LSKCEQNVVAKIKTPPGLHCVIHNQNPLFTSLTAKSEGDEGSDRLDDKVPVCNGTQKCGHGL